MRLRLLTLTALVACGAPDTDSDIDSDADTDGDARVLTDPSGVRLVVPAGALPEGLSVDDLSLTVSDGAPVGLDGALRWGLTPVVSLEPEGLELVKPVQIILPVRAPVIAGLTGTDIPDTIVDAVTQADITVLANAPAMAMGSLYTTFPSITGVAMANAVNVQHQSNWAARSAMTNGVALLYAIDTVVAGSGAWPPMSLVGGRRTSRSAP